MKPTNQKGITLIELMVVMLILTSITVMGATKWIDIIEGKEVANIQGQSKTLEDALSLYVLEHGSYPYKENVELVSVSEGTIEIIKKELRVRGFSEDLFTDLVSSFKTIDPQKISPYLKTFIKDMDRYFFIDRHETTNALEGHVYSLKSIKINDVLYSGKSSTTSD